MNTQTHIENQLALLPPLLEQLRFTDSYIEYGDARTRHHCGGFFRIRHIGTPGGAQFAIKGLHFGAEGSGEYLGNSVDAVMAATAARLAHCHRPLQSALQRRFPAARSTEMPSFFLQSRITAVA